MRSDMVTVWPSPELRPRTSKERQAGHKDVDIADAPDDPVCDDCGQRFPDPSAWAWHTRHVHED